MRSNRGSSRPVAVPALLIGMACGLALATPALAQGGSGSGSSQNTNGPTLSNKEPIQIESDKLEVHQKQNEAIFTGNVNVVQGDTLLKAGRMFVYYTNSQSGDTKTTGTKSGDSKNGDSSKSGDSKANDAKADDTKAGDSKAASGSKTDTGQGGFALGGASDIDHIEVDGKVYVKSKDQVATGDKGTFDMKTQILTLSGKNVVLTRGENVVVGCRLVANLKTGQSKLDGCGGASTAAPGRVKMLLTPTKKNGSEQ